MRWEHFLLAPLSRFGLILEDKTGEKIAFAFLNNCVQEIPVPAPADPETVTAFLKQFRSLTPHPVIHDFEALTRWWLDNPNPLTYQQALGMSDDLYRHFLSHPLISEDEALRLARKGLVTESEYNDPAAMVFQRPYNVLLVWSSGSRWHRKPIRPDL